MSQFDEIIDRRNTNSEKYDFAREYNKPSDVLPLWVADMDFRAPEPVLAALHEEVNHGIFGYSEVKSDYYQSILNWFYKHFKWEAKASWIVKTPGVVFAINTAIHAFTKEKDAILIQPPVYYPFAGVIKNSGRTLITNELVNKNGHYEMDFVDFEKKIRDNHVKMFLLCSPHNPVGRVWTLAELKKIEEICLNYNVIVVSDEIHCDFTYEGHSHTIFAALSPEIAQQSIICTAPSKTFNLAGLQTSAIFIPNEKMHAVFKKTVWEHSAYEELNCMGLVACKAAYDKGEPWLLELKSYLKDNLSFVRSFLEEHLPEIKLTEPEGTYLIWLDCSRLHFSDEELEDFIVNKAKLWLDAGSIFGAHFGQFERINIACPRSVLKKALQQLEQAVRKHKSGTL